MVRSINPEGVPHHNNPIPDPAIHRALLATSAISSRDPETGACFSSRRREVGLCFNQLLEVLAHSGAEPQDVVGVEMSLRDYGDRSLAQPH